MSEPSFLRVDMALLFKSACKVRALEYYHATDLDWYCMTDIEMNNYFWSLSWTVTSSSLLCEIQAVINHDRGKRSDSPATPGNRIKLNINQFRRIIYKCIESTYWSPLQRWTRWTNPYPQVIMHHTSSSEPSRCTIGDERILNMWFFGSFTIILKATMPRIAFSFVP